MKMLSRNGVACWQPPKSGDYPPGAAAYDAKAFALDLAIRMMDLTTLEGKDTEGKVRASDLAVRLRVSLDTIRRDLQEDLVKRGHRVRVYIPFGSAWYPYLMRRMAERPANVLFFLRALAGR